jgi:oxygen-independent coproporphyrinogen-3 oxidase
MEKLYFDTGRLRSPEGRNLSLSRQPISIYIHIPFCAEKCAYCDFFSVPYEEETAEHVLREIIHQCRFYIDLLQPERIESVYFGGGTPSMIPPLKMYRFICELCRLFPNKPAEFTVESNPESLTGDHLQLFAAAGVTRLSVGIQTMHNHSLRLLRRPGTAKDNQESLSLLRSHWTGDLSIDLMCGIPGESQEDLDTTIRTVLALLPGHLSLYTLTVHEGTDLAQEIRKERIIPKNENVMVREWRRGIRLLQAAGYDWYEVSNFALPGKECQHNLRYWHLLPYVGCGPGASSTLFAGNLPVRIETGRDIRLFCAGRISAGYLWNASVCILNMEEYLLEYMLMGLRLRRGIDLHDFASRFGERVANQVTALAGSNRFRGLLSVDSDTVRCTDSGIAILDSLLVQIAFELEKC